MAQEWHQARMAQNRTPRWDGKLSTMVVGEEPAPAGQLTAAPERDANGKLFAIACKQCGYLVHSPTCPTQNPQLHKRVTGNVEAMGMIGVRCSYCGEHGHGQVGCQKRAEAEQYARYKQAVADEHARQQAEALHRLTQERAAIRSREIRAAQDERVTAAARRASERAWELARSGVGVTADQIQRLADEELLKLLQGNSNQQPAQQVHAHNGTFNIGAATYPMWNQPPKPLDRSVVERTLEMYGLK